MGNPSASTLYCPIFLWACVTQCLFAVRVSSDPTILVYVMLWAVFLYCIRANLLLAVSVCYNDTCSDGVLSVLVMWRKLPCSECADDFGFNLTCDCMFCGLVNFPWGYQIVDPLFLYFVTMSFIIPQTTSLWTMLAIYECFCPAKGLILIEFVVAMYRLLRLTNEG